MKKNKKMLYLKILYLFTFVALLFNSFNLNSDDLKLFITAFSILSVFSGRFDNAKAHIVCYNIVVFSLMLYIMCKMNIYSNINENDIFHYLEFSPKLGYFFIKLIFVFTQSYIYYYIFIFFSFHLSMDNIYLSKQRKEDFRKIFTLLGAVQERKLTIEEEDFLVKTYNSIMEFYSQKNTILYLIFNGKTSYKELILLLNTLEKNHDFIADIIQKNRNKK